MFVHEDIRRISNLFEGLGQTFAKVIHYTMPENEDGDKPNIFWLCTIGNKNKHMMSIKQIKMKFKECNCLWGNLEVYGTTSASSHLRNFLKDVGWKVSVIVDGELIVDEEFDFFSAQEFCFKNEIRDPHQLMRLYTSLKTGSPVKHHTAIPEGNLLGQQANARAIFKLGNPLLQMKTVIEAAESRRIGEFRLTPRVSYLLGFLEMHSVCCLSTFLSQKPDCNVAQKTAIWEWLNYMEIDPLMFGLNIVSAINGKIKKGRNILLASQESDVGKSYFLNSLKHALESQGCPIGTFSNTGGRFGFQFCKSDRCLIAIADDIPLEGLEHLQSRQGLLDGETVGAIDHKYGKVEKTSIAPLLIATNEAEKDIKGLATLNARMDVYYMFASKRVLGREGLFEFQNLPSFMENAASEEERMCQLASYLFKVLMHCGIAKLWENGGEKWENARKRNASHHCVKEPFSDYAPLLEYNGIEFKKVEGAEYSYLFRFKTHYFMDNVKKDCPYIQTFVIDDTQF